MLDTASDRFCKIYFSRVKLKLSVNFAPTCTFARLNAGSDILFSNMGDKINRKRKKQQRWFVVTDAAVVNYTLQPSKINRVIPIEVRGGAAAAA